MKKIAIIATSALVTACSSGNYVTNVSSESYQEEYKTAVIEPTIKETMAEVDVISSGETQQKEYPHRGYTIQVVSVSSSEKAFSYAQQLPSDQPVWEHYKQLKGTEWYAVLYGNYATKSEAQAAIVTLPASFQKLPPFVKSFEKIKNSPYPKLKKVR